MLKIAKCTRCGNVHNVNEMVRTSMPKRGNANAYMCSRCANQNEYYHTSNNNLQGKAKVNSVFVGIELETSFTTDNARNQLFEYGMIPTNDCSLHGQRTCEYVSGIQQGLNINSKFAVSVENLMQANELEINDSCGTHFHVSIDSMKDNNSEKTYMGYIARFYHSLFIPLCEAMLENENKTRNLFGRNFTSYAKMITATSDAHNRYNFINVTNNSNIEFRLNKFRNAKQWQTVTKMEVEMVKCIVTNFCEHFNDATFDARRYANITEYRKHKASVTAKKLVKLFEKFSSEF